MSLLSMTGHGQARRLIAGRGCQVELRGVNHRFLEVNIRGVAVSFSLERSIREVIASSVERGRIDVVVSAIDERGPAGYSVSLDGPKLEAMIRLYQQAFEQTGLAFRSDEIRQQALLQILGRYDSLLSPDPVSFSEAEWSSLVLDSLEEAVDGFVASRKVEGERLALDIRERRERLKGYHAKIAEIVESISERIRDRMRQRISRLIEDSSISEERIAQEVAILAERSDITEELVRFDVHLEELRKNLDGGRVGRRLDFIIQELGRETNTIGSKAQDAPVQQLVIEIKSELERIREQVQNIE
jgi:uncharacterized protein (TIGR00255 family)